MADEFCFIFNKDIIATSSTGKDPLLPFKGKFLLNSVTISQLYIDLNCMYDTANVTNNQ